LKKFGFKLPL